MRQQLANAEARLAMGGRNVATGLELLDRDATRSIVLFRDSAKFGDNVGIPALAQQELRRLVKPDNTDTGNRHCQHKGAVRIPDVTPSLAKLVTVQICSPTKQRLPYCYRTCTDRVGREGSCISEGTRMAMRKPLL